LILARTKMDAYSPKEYWAGVAETNRSADSSGFAPVLHPDAPAWFNRLMDESQFRVMRRALRLAKISAGSRVLDVGCGTGRWVRRYEAMGFSATGVDATPGMLRLALDRGTAAPLVGGQALHLPFADAAFDLVSDVTVVQHIPLALQPQALEEMLRVLKPGGRLVLLELIRGTGAHIFPRRPRDWIEQVASRGAKLIAWFGQEFFLLDRLFVSVARSLAGKNGARPQDAGPSGASLQPGKSLPRRLYWKARHVTAPLSAFADPIVEKVCPAGFATHGVFVFQK
jgi:SAM-dependent methyltransferase